MQSWIEPFESLINLSVSVTILLFTVKSKFSPLCNRVLRVKCALDNDYDGYETVCMGFDINFAGC